MLHIYRLMVTVCLVLLTPTVWCQWTQSNWPSGNLQATPSDFVVSGTRFISSGYGWQGAFLSFDSGLTWTSSNSGLSSTLIYDLLIHRGTVFAGTGGGMFVSHDTGASWSLSDTGMTDKQVDAMVEFGQYIYAGTTLGGVYRSSDIGATWLRVSDGITDTNVYAICVNGSSIFAGTFSAGVFRSDDSGLTWTATNNGLNHLHIYELFATGGAIFAGTNTGGVYRSLDNGNSWIQVNNGQTSNHVYSFAASGDVLFAGTKDSGVFQSGDLGNSWSEVNQGFTKPVTIYALQACGEYLLAGVYTQGAWRRPLANFPSDISSNSRHSIPEGFEVYQNVPNPFNPSTTISFSLPTRTEVSIDIFNSLGRKVQFRNLHSLSAGTHHWAWDGNDGNGRQVASGVYFYRVRAGSHVRSMKMLLMK